MTFSENVSWLVPSLRAKLLNIEDILPSVFPSVRSKATCTSTCTRYRMPWILYLVQRILDLELLMPGISDNIFAWSFTRYKRPKKDLKYFEVLSENHGGPFAFWKNALWVQMTQTKIWNIIWNEKRKEKRGTRHEQQFETHPGVAGVSFRRVWLTLRSSWPCYPIIRLYFR